MRYISVYHEEYIESIEREPLPDMLKQNADGFFYIPLSIIQSELRMIYLGMTKWEMVEVIAKPEGLYGYGKLWYKLPFSVDGGGVYVEEWLFQTGTAAIPNKKMRLSYPSLEGHCLLNAAKKIGPWFGQNLNRDQEEEVDEETKIPIINIAEQRLEVLIDNCSTIEDLGKFHEDAKKSKETYVLYMQKLKSMMK